MTYQEQEFFISESSQPQQPYSQKRIFNNHNNRWYPSHLSSSKSLRIECKTEERHFLGNTCPYYNIDSSLKPIRCTMSDQLEPGQFRSEIIVHNNTDTDIHIKRLRVAFRYHDDPPENATLNNPATSLTESSIRSRSVDMPRSSISQTQQQQQQQKDNDSKRKFQSATSSQSKLLHQWIDDICSNEKLMATDNIVFFIKNGEFFARI
ncbi:unnamed protein product [Rotaria sp. Silwood2]|nr:unnamed protein product [Rotaria sp. Silwood2]CAF2675142.1 unnamed protein product [Rotaria sp. Silwood2]CAF2929734.1 unnamed protein product [Rotaria sp. Silwood2]CAF3083038.1 unnamed protein product [Rotaria sp. Silwood2]CAF4312668.1 unnamed protein product [Rotaria sp. Silwood2]